MTATASWKRLAATSLAGLTAVALCGCGSNGPTAVPAQPSASTPQVTQTDTFSTRGTQPSLQSASSTPRYGEAMLISKIHTSTAKASVADAIASTIANFNDLMGSGDTALAAKYRELIVPKEQNYFDLEDSIKVGVKNELDNPGQGQAGMVAESWNTRNVSQGFNQNGVPDIGVQDLTIQFNPVVGAPQTISYGAETVDFVFNPAVTIDGKTYGVWQICDDVTAGQVHNSLG